MIRKVTIDQMGDIYLKRALGVKLEAIALEYGVSPSTIHRWLHQAKANGYKALTKSPK